MSKILLCQNYLQQSPFTHNNKYLIWMHAEGLSINYINKIGGEGYEKVWQNFVVDRGEGEVKKILRQQLYLLQILKK